MKRHRVDFLPSTGLHEELELWHQQWRLASIRLLGECRQIWVSLSWFLDLLYWLRVWVYLVVEQFTCPLPVGKIPGGGGREWSIQGIPTHGLDTEEGSAETYQEITTQSKDTGWAGQGEGWKMPGEWPTQWKGTGGEGSFGKKSRNTWGSAEWYQGRSVLGDWRVFAEWVSKRLMWHFSFIWLPM